MKIKTSHSQTWLIIKTTWKSLWIQIPRPNLRPRYSESLRVQGICVFRGPREYLATFGNLTLCLYFVLFWFPRNQCLHSITVCLSSRIHVVTRSLSSPSWKQEERLTCLWISHWSLSPTSLLGDPWEHLEGFPLWKKWGLESMNYCEILEGVLTL